MAGIVHVHKNKKLLLALVFIATIACFFCFAQRAEAHQDDAHAITLLNSNAEYKIRMMDVATSWPQNPVSWNTKSVADGGDGAFVFSIVWDQKRFARMDPWVRGATNISIEKIDTISYNDPVYGQGDYPVYSIANLGEDAVVYADLYCEIKLIPYSDPARPNTIYPASSFSLFVKYNENYTFKVLANKWSEKDNNNNDVTFFPLCKVKSYNTYDNTNEKLLNYSSVNTSAGNNQFEFTYNIDKILQNTTFEVYDIVRAYTVQLPDIDADICITDPVSGIYVIELNLVTPIPFTFDMYFTAKYGDSIPHASVTGHPNLNVTWNKTGQGSEGQNIFKVNVPSPGISTALTVTFNTANWNIIKKGVLIQENPSYYALNPANAYMQVDYDANGIFYIIPTAAYAHNTSFPNRNPIISVTSGYTATVENQGSQYKCTILGLKHTVDVKINVSLWEADPNAPSGSVSVITMPTGDGYSISNILGGYALGSNKYRVNNGADFSFSVNVLSGYDASSLNVSVAGQRLFPVNNVYTIPSVNANLTVTASVSKTGATATTSPGGGSGTTGTGTGTSTGAADDGELKYREIYDEKLGIMISGFFVGVPKLKITDLISSDPVYIRMLKSSGATEDKVLRAVDVQILNGTLYGTLTLGLHVGVGYNTIEMLVIHGTSRGDEKFKVLGRDGMASIGVRSTSPFMVVDPDGLGPGASSTGTTSIDSADGVTIGPPRTGGAKNVMGFILLGIVAFSIVFIIWYRKRDA